MELKTDLLKLNKTRLNVKSVDNGAVAVSISAPITNIACHRDYRNSNLCTISFLAPGLFPEKVLIIVRSSANFYRTTYYTGKKIIVGSYKSLVELNEYLGSL